MAISHHQAGLEPDLSDRDAAALSAFPAMPVAPDALVALICAHRGVVTAENLRHAGFSSARIATWVRDGLLHEHPQGVYRLDAPDVYIDWRLLALWSLPATTTAIIGGLTALDYHGVSVAWVNRVDAALAPPPPPRIPSETQITTYAPAAVPPSLPPSALPSPHRPSVLRLFQLPADLWEYGREDITPALPGSVSFPMYTPAVALAQVLWDHTHPTLLYDEDSLLDAMMGYLGTFGQDAQLAEAISRYGVRANWNQAALQLEQMTHTIP